MNPWMIRLAKAPIRLAIGGWMAATFLGSLVAMGQAPDIPRGKHGDATSEYQLKELQKLLPPWDVTKAPPGFDPVVWAAFIPEDNKLTPERVDLGRKLYFDTRLSRDGSVSCATCHDVTRGFTDQRPVSEGIGGQLGKRNAPTTLNVALLQTLFWDGRSPTLDHQAKTPLSASSSTATWRPFRPRPAPAGNCSTARAGA